MSETTLDKRFFESTRGKIVLALRTTERTVNELAAELILTDNAVRAHLITLERDGLVEHGGTIKGFRKPQSIYRLTDEARHLFPKFYHSLFNRLLDSIKSRMSASALRAVLDEVGRGFAVGRTAKRSESLKRRVDKAVLALQDLGGAATAVVEDEKLMIKSNSCPLADAITEHPETCKIAESMIQEIVGEKVSEICDRRKTPRCRFLIETNGST